MLLKLTWYLLCPCTKNLSIGACVLILYPFCYCVTIL
jgi:hypothetical protein